MEQGMWTWNKVREGGFGTRTGKVDLEEGKRIWKGEADLKLGMWIWN